MTVSEKLDNKKYWCEWFKGASKERSVFSESSLKPYDPPKKND